MRTKINLFFLFFTTVLLAQQRNFQIDWNDQKQISTMYGSITVAGFSDDHFNYDHSKQTVSYNTHWDVQNPDQTFDIENIVYQPIAANLLENINLEEIPTDLQYSITTSRARDKSMAVLSLNPYVKEGGAYKRIVSFEVKKSPMLRIGQSSRFSSPPITNSVLATGDWYRFYVEKTGVHRISKDFLSSLGIDVNSIDPRKLKIYSHGGAALPLVNEDNQYYDLPQNTIKVVGQEDGSFDDDDYILFYGTGTRGYDEENNTHINPYADRSYYYITYGGSNGLRVQNATQPSGPVGHSITTFDDYQFYETDEYNPARLGRRWFGDRFDVQNQRSYNFQFPNLISSEPVRLKVAAIATAQVETYMGVRVNGQQVSNLSFGTISSEVLARGEDIDVEVPVNSDNVNVSLSYNNNGNPGSNAYLDYISVEAKRLLRIEGGQLTFSSKDVASLPGIGEYVVQNTSAVNEIWDVTDHMAISAYINAAGNSTFSFKTSLGETRKYVALHTADYYAPLKESNPQVSNQDLKGRIFYNAQNSFEDIDYLIITDKLLLPQAEKLAAYRGQHDNLNVKVVTVDKIYAEFNSGKQDVAAIRNFIKYVYDNASSPANRVKYVALFGEASVDYKDRLEGNNNVVPTFEALEGYDLLNSYVTDDFYGMMDPQEGDMDLSNLLDIATGRILADSPQMAEAMVNKIIAYEKKEAYGRWRNNVLMISDDAINSSEFTNFMVFTNNLANSLQANKPALNVQKMQVDAYQQETSAGGDRYPEVNEAINDAVEVGALMINYFGHGGENGLAHERILTQSDILSWSNNERFPLFITVTCEFTKYDNPVRISAGELVVNRANSGAAGMISTTREILISQGKTFNNALLPYLFGYNQNTTDDSVAESLRKAKNSVNISGRRIIMFFGDPAMKLALPKPNVRLTSINDLPIDASIDTLKALSKVKLAGEVVSPNGTLLSNYNGLLAATIFDKEIERQTLGNDNVSQNGEVLVLDFNTLGEIIYRGQASVANGQFEFEFVVPKDIAIPVGTGRVSFYAEKNAELEDQTGYNNSILIGDINENAPEDNEGPQIQLYMNDENFVSGGVTNSSPYILAKLEDENGINTASGIGHDIVAILDGDETNPYILNDYYETEVDDFTKGTTYYRLRELEPGPHTLTFKAWDVYNNSSTVEVQFMVAGDDELSITKVLNYPNPFHTYTEFWFNHNRPFEPLEVQVQVFTVAGKVVWTQNQVINTDGFLSREITWDGKDDFGDAIGKGVYVYKLTVKSTMTNKKVEKFEKLVIL